MARKLFVGNLSFNTEEGRLQELFEGIGPVDSVNIVRDQMTGRARGFAFWPRTWSSRLPPERFRSI